MMTIYIKANSAADLKYILESISEYGSVSEKFDATSCNFDCVDEEALNDCIDELEIRSVNYELI